VTRSRDLLMAYTGRSLLQWFASRSFLVTLVVEQSVMPLLGLAVWSAAAPGDNKAIGPYYLALLLAQLATVSYEHHTVANGIYAGSFSQELVIPHPTVLVFLGQNLALRILHVLFGLPVLVLLAVFLGPPVEPRNIAVAIPALLLAAAIRFLFTYSLALAAFWTHQAHGVVGFGEMLIYLLGGSAIPIAFFPDRAREIVEILPFRAMLGFPAEVATGTVRPGEVVAGYALQILWLGIATMMAVITWRRGVRRFTAIGG
jgi:ABC-2 type transport system permease protein